MNPLLYLRAFALLAILLLPVWARGQTIAAGQAFELVIPGVTQGGASVDGVYRVDQFGMLRLPMIGDIQAAGLTASQLADVIEVACRTMGLNPTARPQVISGCGGQATPNDIAVGGYVNQPGMIRLLSGMTLGQAIKSAGGANEFGALRRVRLMRNGKQREYDLNLAEGQNVPLEEGDVVEVPQKAWIGR